MTSHEDHSIFFKILAWHTSFNAALNRLAHQLNPPYRIKCPQSALKSPKTVMATMAYTDIQHREYFTKNHNANHLGKALKVLGDLKKNLHHEKIWNCLLEKHKNQILHPILSFLSHFNGLFKHMPRLNHIPRISSTNLHVGKCLSKAAMSTTTKRCVRKLTSFYILFIARGKPIRVERVWVFVDIWQAIRKCW